MDCVAESVCSGAIASIRIDAFIHNYQVAASRILIVRLNSRKQALVCYQVPEQSKS
jgi:hypothetical protein